MAGPSPQAAAPRSSPRDERSRIGDGENCDMSPDGSCPRTARSMKTDHAEAARGDGGPTVISPRKLPITGLHLDDKHRGTMTVVQRRSSFAGRAVLKSPDDIPYPCRCSRRWSGIRILLLAAFHDHVAAGEIDVQDLDDSDASERPLAYFALSSGLTRMAWSRYTAFFWVEPLT